MANAKRQYLRVSHDITLVGNTGASNQTINSGGTNDVIVSVSYK